MSITPPDTAVDVSIKRRGLVLFMTVGLALLLWRVW